MINLVTIIDIGMMAIHKDDMIPETTVGVRLTHGKCVLAKSIFRNFSFNAVGFLPSLVLFRG